ncbi:MAG: DUF3710 domain-containing protein [Sporichthyaceae bacterium]
MAFRRKGKDEASAAAESVEAQVEASEEAPAALPPREGGPWDFADVPDDKIERVDLGGVLIPIVDGMELRAEIAEERVVAATLIIGRSAIQIQPFAAPRTMGIWDEVRQEIASGIVQGGGEVQDAEGRFGSELVATVPVALPDGTAGFQVARFLGVDGPRWFLRAVITGEGAMEEEAREPLESLLADVVVVRGADAMAPRDPIELRLPEEITSEMEAADEDEDEAARRARVEDFNPFERGPEITEIR